MTSQADEEVATFLEITLSLAKLKFKKRLPEVEPQKLEEIGKGIVQIVQLWDGNRESDMSPDFSLIAAKILEYLNYYFENDQ